MTTKVLVAEDSLTVQKVINFTLESEPFELDYCKSEDELFKKFKKGEYNLVFLDMNLSTQKTGYDLSKELRLIDPDISILGLFGTFDVVEENSLKDAGIGEKIIKPFESAKFIEVCRNLAGLEADLVSLPLVEEESVEDEEWTVNAPDIEVGAIAETPSMKEAEDDLKSWGVDIPEVIEENIEALDESLLEEGAELIETINLIEPDVEELDEMAIPSDVDLELPATVLNMPHTLPEEDLVEETREISHTPESKTNIEEDINEDISPDDFWAADETVVVDLEEVKVPEVEPKQVVAATEITDDIMAKIKESLRPLIEQEVKKYCQETLEKVAWEVIPDLAENLIRKEIKDIAKSED